MLIDANELPESSHIDCDVCVAGSGPAGITIANELGGGPVEVCLLETGGLPHEAAIEASSVAEQLGVPVDVLKFRRRAFGGASNLWGGVRRRWLRLRPLDPIDFEQRPWVPNSGWPFKYEELLPFFERASKTLEIPSFGDFALGAHREHLAPELHNDEVNTTIFQVARPRRFGEDAHSLAMSENVRVYTHARAIEIEEDPTAPVVRYLRFMTPGGRTHRIAARRFVLACGGLENPRLLLVSRRKAACGIGNEHDLVGRYYMQHPKGFHGVAILDRDRLRSPLYTQRHLRNGVLISAGLSFSEEVQLREKVLNHCIMFRPILSLSESYASEAYRALCRAWQGRDERAGGYREFLDASISAASVFKWLLKNPRLGRVFRVANHMEQAPKPESRLDLSKHTDQLGVRQLRTDWRIDSFEKESLCRLHELVRRKLAFEGVGRLESQFDPRADRWPISQDSAHHLGATRMHSDPGRGVTDPDCRVHSVQNLYISGGSLFPTSGYANPTFTIVALAIRLADHLKRLHTSDAAGRGKVIDRDGRAEGAPRASARQADVGDLPPKRPASVS